MLYTVVKSISLSLRKIHTSNDTKEHVTSRATDGLLHNYFPLDKFAITPEQTKMVSRKKPDYSVELVNNDDFKPYLFAEVKSLVSSNFTAIMDQLHDSILFAVDNSVSYYSVYAIAMKATKIAFFEFYSFVSLLEDYGIPNYRGFLPLNQLISMESFVDINNYYQSDPIHKMLRYYSKYWSLITDKQKLINMEVDYTEKIPHPHIWDLLNKDHEDHIHNLFTHMSKNLPGKDIV